ncbi:low temperature requirement protein A [Streptomyces wuyuanensis]|uniref:low temperature requirement protein A n=1 Tax=Streptomyces wuyuanensis TaxID=1196353 RepID=UPI00371F8411
MSPLELFYDLVFVFAISQLSHHLLEHLTWRGAAETAVLLVAVFGTWAYTSYEATLLDVHRKVTRWMIVVALGLGLFMNAAISHAFDDRAWAFVIALLLILFFAGTVTALAGRTDALREHFRRTLVWLAASAPLWIIGAAVGPDPRLWWWAAAALVDLTGTWLAHPLPGRTLSGQELAFDARHMIERLRLFFIILLGETVLTAGRVMVDVLVDLPGILAAAYLSWPRSSLSPVGDPPPEDAAPVFRLARRRRLLLLRPDSWSLSRNVSGTLRPHSTRPMPRRSRPKRPTGAQRPRHGDCGGATQGACVIGGRDVDRHVDHGSADRSMATKEVRPG